MMQTVATEKIHKVLARQGLGSRRYIESLIEQKRVKLNGKVAKIGERISPCDKIAIDDKPVEIKLTKSTRVLIYNKPIGEICTRRQSHHEPIKSVFDKLPKLSGERWISIGRLDINSSGLLLFTTDGELANKLMHPSTVTDREYSVRVFGKADKETLEALKVGVELDGELCNFSDIVINNEFNNNQAGGLSEQQANHWLTVCLQSGKNREVRRIFETKGLTVNRLKRVRYATIYLPAWLRAGYFIDLEANDIATLYRHCKLTCPKIYQPTPSEKNIAARQLRKMRAKGK